MATQDYVCLIVGEAPTTQFLSWRLSLTNAFLIQVSEYIASDGVISWKSNKYGSNFYKPNIFAKDLSTLDDIIIDKKNKLKYDVDLLVLTANSMKQCIETVDKISKYISPKTLIVVDCNFGVNLDQMCVERLKHIRHLGVLSLLCEIECRKLSSGSYALVSEICDLYFGLTYTFNDESQDNLISNSNLVNEQYKEPHSTLNKLIEMIKSTDIKNVYKISTGTSDMSIRVWYYVIPKIAFNALSIIFEDPNYEMFTKISDIPRALSEDIVKELMVIAYRHTNTILEKYCISVVPQTVSHSDIQQYVSFENVFAVVKSKCVELNSFTISEAPEYLTLSFEAYSFYHKIDYPASLLLSQPLELAESYGTSKTGISFLFGFYSKLSSLAGVALDGQKLVKSSASFLLGGKMTAALLNELEGRTNPSNTNPDGNLPKQRKQHTSHKLRTEKTRNKNENLGDSFGDDLHTSFQSVNIESDGSDGSSYCLQDVSSVHSADVCSTYSEYECSSNFHSQEDNLNAAEERNTHDVVSRPLSFYSKDTAIDTKLKKKKDGVFSGYHLYNDLHKRNLTNVYGNDFDNSLRHCPGFRNLGREYDFYNMNPVHDTNSCTIELTEQEKRLRKHLLNKMASSRKNKLSQHHTTMEMTLRNDNSQRDQKNYLSALNIGGIGEILNVSSSRFGNIEIGPQLLYNSDLKLKPNGFLRGSQYVDVDGSFKSLKYDFGQKLIELPKSEKEE